MQFYEDNMVSEGSGILMEEMFAENLDLKRRQQKKGKVGAGSWREGMFAG